MCLVGVQHSCRCSTSASTKECLPVLPTHNQICRMLREHSARFRTSLKSSFASA